MKVAFIAPLPFSLAFGGLEVQVLHTARALAAFGIEAELLDPWKPRFDADLLHCFGSEYQLEEAVARARAMGIPVVVSAVFLPRKPALMYRVWKGVDPLLPLKTSFGARRRILRAADAVIALTRREAADLVRIFHADHRKVHVIPNGVEERFFAAGSAAFQAHYGLSGFVLCAGSLEGRKNQDRLIRAVDGSGLPLVLIGPPSAAEPEYARQVAGALRRGGGAHWIQGLAHDSPLLASAYAAATVVALPSLSEGQPLVALEAAAAGANLVLSNLPYLREAFGEHAWYCDPRSVQSIRGAVLDAYRAPRGARYVSRPPWLLSWTDVGLRLRDVYDAVLMHKAAGSTDANPTGDPSGAVSPG